MTESTSEIPPVVAVDDLAVHFGKASRGLVRAVDGVSIRIGTGETVGLIGESGSGKSTVGLAILGLLDPTRGHVRVRGEEAWKGSRRRQSAARREVQAIFQDPSEALDPRMTIAESIAEPLRINGRLSRAQRAERVVELLERVGLDPSYRTRHPHELSGGQKQRVNIARALVLDPSVIVCDEAVSALDVSIQADILNLLGDLQRDTDVSYLFISHDIGVIAHIADRICVMYLGRIVEEGATADVLANPRHPYTRSLISAAPQALPSALRTPKPAPLQGDIPSPANLPSGCRFQTRCPMAHDGLCRDVDPKLLEVLPGRWSACHYSDELKPTELAVTGSPASHDA